MMCLCLLFNEVDLVFIEIIVGCVTPVNASSMRGNLVLLDKVPRVDWMPDKVHRKQCLCCDERVFPFMK